MLDSIYLHSGKVIECDWTVVETDDGEQREQLRTNLTNQELYGLCQNIVNVYKLQGSVSEVTKTTMAILCNRQSWNAIPTEHDIIN